MELKDLESKKGKYKLADLPNKAPHLSDDKMKKMVPMFVEAGKYPEDDHKCGVCNMRTPSGQCTVVEVTIDREKGTCIYWAGGASAGDEDIHESRMEKSVGGYVLSDEKVQCGTCIKMKQDYCTLWKGSVLAKECCMAWSSGREYENPMQDGH